MVNSHRPPTAPPANPRPPAKRARLALASVAVACGLAACMRPAVARGEAGRSPVRSSDLHYLVSGLPSGENLRWVERLGALEEAVEKWVGREVPFAGQPPVAVSFRTRADGTEPVVKIQGWEDGRFLQRLAAPGAWGVENGDFAEAACWLLVNRLASESTPAEYRFGMGAEAPDWLSCGLAQVCDAGWRARSRSWVAKDWREGRTMPLAEVVKLGSLPSGQWREKAYAGMAVEFLLPAGDAVSWQAAFDALGRRETLSPRWLKAHCGALAGKNPEEEWRAWLARAAAAGDAAAAGRQDRSLAQESLLMDVLRVRPRDAGPDVPDGVPEEVFAGELATWRGQEWCTRLAGRLRIRVQELAPGSPPALREALAGYAAYFAELGKPPQAKKHWWQFGDDGSVRAPDDDAWGLALNQLWQRAEQSHRDFLETTLARKVYVDGWDLQSRREGAGAGGGAEGEEGGMGDWEGRMGGGEEIRTPLQRYVDRVEGR